MNPMLIYAGLQAGASGLKYLSNRYSNKNRQKFGDSAYGNYLRKIQKQGMYSPGARNIIQSNVNRQTASVTDASKNAYMGRMINRGNENSISNQRAMNVLDMKRADINARTAEDISLANERSKVSAEGQYSKLAYQDKLTGQEFTRQNRNELIGGVGGAAAGYFANKINATTVPGEGNKQVAGAQTPILSDYSSTNKRIMDRMTESEQMNWWQALSDEERQRWYPVMERWYPELFN